MIRPLYLLSPPDLRVRLDRRALRVQGPGRTERLFPVGRLSRVVSRTSVEWSTEALVACMRAGVPVFLMEPGLATLGSCAPHRPRETELAELLDELLALDGGQALYDDWCRAMQRGSLLEAIRHIPPDLLDLRPDKLECALRNRLRSRFGIDRPERIVDSLAELLGLLVRTVLLTEGVEIAAHDSAGARLSLAARIEAIMRADLYRVAERMLARSGHDERALVRAFESRAPILERHIRTLLARLSLHLRSRLR